MLVAILYFDGEVERKGQDNVWLSNRFFTCFTSILRIVRRGGFPLPSLLLLWFDSVDLSEAGLMLHLELFLCEIGIVAII